MNRILQKAKRFGNIDSLVWHLEAKDPTLPIESIYMLLQALDLPESEWSYTVYDDTEVSLDREAGYGLGEEQLQFFGLGGLVEVQWTGVSTKREEKANLTVISSTIHDRRKASDERFKQELIAVCRRFGKTCQSGSNVLMFASWDLEAEYTDEQLKEAFELVQAKDHWKNPIDCYVYLSEGERELVSKAVSHYTGGLPEFERVTVNKGPVRVRRRRLIDDGAQYLYRVTAPGYYVCIGA